MYADDCTVALMGKNTTDLENQANAILKSFALWCSKNKLIVSESKTCYMVFSNRKELPSKPNLTLNNKLLNNTYNLKFLGLYLHLHMKWGNHLDHVAGKINSAYFAMRNLRSILDIKQHLLGPIYRTQENLYYTEEINSTNLLLKST